MNKLHCESIVSLSANRDVKMDYSRFKILHAGYPKTCGAHLIDDKCLIWKRVVLMVETHYFVHTIGPDSRFLERNNINVLFKQFRVTCYSRKRFTMVILCCFGNPRVTDVDAV